MWKRIGIAAGVMVLWAVGAWADPSLPGQPTPLAVGLSSGTTNQVSTLGSFNTAPRITRGTVEAMNTMDRRVTLVMPDQQLIEITVPRDVPIYSADNDLIRLDQLAPQAFVRVRYRPLTLVALEVRELPQ